MIEPFGELGRFVRASLLDPVAEPVLDDPATARRRRLVVLATLAAGAIALGATVRLPAGSPTFVPMGLALAAIWLIGAFASGPMHLGRVRTRSGTHLARPIVQPFALGVAMLIVFLAGGLVVSRLPPLREPVSALLDHSRVDTWPLVVAMTAINGVAEEVFFRGALYAAVRRYAVAVTTGVYALTTIGAGIPLLVLAAVFMGVVTGLQRRVTGGVLGPIVTHVTWSTGMFFLLPLIL